MFRTIIACVVVLCGAPGIAGASETLLCNRFKPAQWIDVRLVPPHEETRWWAALPANECFAIEVSRKDILAEARDVSRRPLIINVRCFSVRHQETCIIDE